MRVAVASRIARSSSIHPRLRRHDFDIVVERLHVHRPVVDARLARRRRPSTACASSSSRRRAPGKSSRACAPRIPCGSRPTRSSPPPGRAGSAARSVSIRSEFQTSERSLTLARRRTRRGSSRIFAHAFRQRLAGAEHRGVGLHRALHVSRGSPRSACRRWRCAGGRGWPAPCRRRSPAGPCAAGPGLIVSAQRLATARPNTTRSSSEFEPSRLAPCTDTQAASPIAYRPGTTASGLPSLQLHDFAVVVGRDAAHVVVHGRHHRDRLLRRRRRRRRSARSRRCPAASRGCTSGRGGSGRGGCGPCARRRRGLRGSRSSSSATDHVARGEVLRVRRVALHEALALRLRRMPPSPRTPSVIRQPAP